MNVSEHLSGANSDHLFEFVFVEPNSCLSGRCPVCQAQLHARVAMRTRSSMRTRLHARVAITHFFYSATEMELKSDVAQSWITGRPMGQE